MLLASEMKIPGRRGPGDLAQFGDEGCCGATRKNDDESAQLVRSGRCRTRPAFRIQE